jgi:hypothetical protein
MALMNILNKLNISQPQAVVAPQPTNNQVRNTPAPQRFTGDTLVRSGAVPTSRPTTNGVAANNQQDLGFNELMAKNPGLIWQTALTPRTKQAIEAYKAGMLGRSVQNLDLRNKTAEQVRQELTRRGFQCEMGVIKDVRTGKPVINPKTGKQVPMEIWSHADGGMVRIKPEGDPTNMHRPQPHLSMSVKYPPSADGHDFNDEAFKVDHCGHALPKWAKDVKNPHDAACPAGKKFLDDHANRTHVNLR